MKKIKLITEKWKKFISSDEKLIAEEPRSKSNWQQLTPSPPMHQPPDTNLRVKEQFPRPRIMGGANNDELVEQEGAYSFYRKNARDSDPTGSGYFYRVVWTPRDRSKNKIIATSKSSLLENSAAAHVKKVIKCLGDLIVNQVEGLPNRGPGSAKDPNIGKPPPNIAACQEMGFVEEAAQQQVQLRENRSKEQCKEAFHTVTRPLLGPTGVAKVFRISRIQGAKSPFHIRLRQKEGMAEAVKIAFGRIRPLLPVAQKKLQAQCPGAKLELHERRPWRLSMTIPKTGVKTGTKKGKQRKQGKPRKKGKLPAEIKANNISVPMPPDEFTSSTIVYPANTLANSNLSVNAGARYKKQIAIFKPAITVTIVHPETMKSADVWGLGCCKKSTYYVTVEVDAQDPESNSKRTITHDFKVSHSALPPPPRASVKVQELVSNSLWNIREKGKKLGLTFGQPAQGPKAKRRRKPKAAAKIPSGSRINLSGKGALNFPDGWFQVGINHPNTDLLRWKFMAQNYGEYKLEYYIDRGIGSHARRGRGDPKTALVRVTHEGPGGEITEIVITGAAGSADTKTGFKEVMHQAIKKMNKKMKSLKTDSPTRAGIQVRQGPKSKTATIQTPRGKKRVRTRRDGYSPYFKAVQEQLLRDELKGLTMKGLQGLVWIASKAVGLEPDLGEFGEIDLDGDGTHDGLDGKYGGRTYSAIKRLQQKLFPNPGADDMQGRDKHDGLVGWGTMAAIAAKLKVPGKGEDVAKWFVNRATKYAGDNAKIVKTAFEELKDEIPASLIKQIPKNLMQLVSKSIVTAKGLKATGRAKGTAAPKAAVKMNVDKLKKSTPQAKAAAPQRGPTYARTVGVDPGQEPWNLAKKANGPKLKARPPSEGKTLPPEFYSEDLQKKIPGSQWWVAPGYHGLGVTVQLYAPIKTVQDVKLLSKIDGTRKMGGSIHYVAKSEVPRKGQKGPQGPTMYVDTYFRNLQFPGKQIFPTPGAHNIRFIEAHSIAKGPGSLIRIWFTKKAMDAHNRDGQSVTPEIRLVYTKDQIVFNINIVVKHEK